MITYRIPTNIDHALACLRPRPWLFAAMAATVFVAAVAQGIGGVGFAMLAAPVAGIFFPQLAPGPLLTLGGFVSR